MKKVLLLVFVTVFCCSMISACSSSPASSSDSNQTIQITCDTLFYQKDITKNVNVKAGDTVTLVVCANHENSFTWDENANIASTAVVQKSHTYTPPATADSKDTSGKETFVFQVAGGKTDTSLSITYSRPSEGTSSRGTLTIIFYISK
jgi:predicted secreted protein